MIVSGPSRRPESPEELLSPSLAASLDRLDLRSKKLFPGKLPGERRSKKRGQSVEFADHRNYVPGDDLRFIDWNIYARFDRLFIKLFMEEEDLALHLVVDASPSMDTPAQRSANGEDSPDATPQRLGVNKRLFACRAAMALAYIGLTKQNRVGVTVFGGPGVIRPAFLPDARGRHNVRRIASFLMDNAWPSAGETGDPTGLVAPSNDLGAALTQVARSRVGKGVIVVLSDFFTQSPDGFEPGLRSLGAVSGSGGFEVFCLQTLAPSEVEPELLGREALDGLAGDLRLTDAESGRATEVTITPALIRGYKQRIDAYCAALQGFCAARQMVHILVRTDVPIDTLMTEVLRRRGVLA